MNKFIPLISVISLMFLTACSNNAQPAEQNQTVKTDTETDTQTNISMPTTGTDSKINLDPALLNTGIAKADLTNYAYPFKQDSTAVQNYAKAYQITAQEAQHAMTLSMASPEALNKVLDQIVGEYVGHSLTDGKHMSLVVYTTDKVNPTEFEYVIADKFGEGLVLPVKVVQASGAKEKPQVDTQALENKFHTTNDE